MSLVERARIFALAAHGEQRYGGRPYCYHLERVAGVVREYGAELGEPLEELEAAAWLHDTLEDTAVTAAELEREFGATVAGLVEAVTNEPEVETATATTYRKTRAAGRRAVGLKLCDRTANLRESQARTHRHHLRRYRGGYEAFHSILHREGELPKLWAEVARLIEGWKLHEIEIERNGRWSAMPGMTSTSPERAAEYLRRVESMWPLRKFRIRTIPG